MRILSKTVFLAATAMALVGAGAAHAATVITFEAAAGNGQQALPSSYQPLLGGYVGDGGALGVTIGWGGTNSSSRLYNSGVTDHTPGGNGLGAVGYDGGAGSNTITFSKAVTLPSFYYANYDAGAYQITFTGFLNGVQVASITENYTQPSGYTWLEETGFAGIAIDSFTFSGPTYKQLDDITVQAVPEPATWGMMLAGFGMIGFAARRRSSVKKTVAVA